MQATISRREGAERLAGDSPIARCWSASSPRQLPVLLVLAGALAVGTVAHAQTEATQDNVTRKKHTHKKRAAPSSSPEVLRSGELRISWTGAFRPTPGAADLNPLVIGFIDIDSGTVSGRQDSRSDIVWQDNVQTSVTSMRSANGANIAWAFPSAATYSSCTKNLESPPGGPDGHLHHPKSDKYCIRTTEGNVALFENVTYNIHSSLPGVIDSITVVARYTLWNKQ